MGISQQKVLMLKRCSNLQVYSHAGSSLPATDSTSQLSQKYRWLATLGEEYSVPFLLPNVVHHGEVTTNHPRELGLVPQHAPLYFSWNHRVRCTCESP